MKESVVSVAVPMRRARPRRRALVFGAVAASVCGVLLAGALGAGAYVEHRVRERLSAAGAARGLSITCERVHLRLGGVRVRGIEVSTLGAGADEPHASAHVEDVEVDLSLGGAPQQIRVHGGHIEAVGELDALRERFSKQASAASAGSSAPALDVQVDALDVSWRSPLGTLSASGVGTRVLADGARVVTAQHVQVAASSADAELEARGLSVELVDRLVRAAHIEEIALTRTRVAVTPGSAPVPTSDAEAPLTLPWPATAAWRVRLLALAERAASHLTGDAALRVEGLRVELGNELRFGPAPFRIQRRPSALVVELAPEQAGAGPAGSTPLSFHVDVPLGDATGDPSATLEGGPVPLSVLGLRDGQLFLHGTSAATLRGRGKVVLGEPLRVDLSVDVAHVGVQHPRLAREPIDDVSFGLDLRGSVSERRELIVEDARFRLGELTVSAHGSLASRDAAALAGRGALEILHVGCESLHRAVPAALAPHLAEFRFGGDFAFSAALEFDTQKLDELSLDVRQMGTCRALATPEWAARAHLQGEFTHTVYDAEGKPRDETTGPGSGNWTSIGRISPFMQVAVLTSEDGGFFHHHGWNKGAIRRALIANLKAGRFRQGASTISMQLSKNLFLSRDKTLGRKLEELVLTDYLEQSFDKSEMMELYLNIIEFGPDVYGITQAARYYFGRAPEELQLAECMFLASILPSPVRRSRIRARRELTGASRGGIDFLIRAAEKTGKISRREMEEGLVQPIVFHLDGARPPLRAPVRGSRFEGDAPEDEGMLVPDGL